MQDGFIFSESIAQNIAVGEEQIDIERLRHAVTVANIRDFIDSLPLDYNTKIGMEGNGISQGQRQRILIARAVYKNPEFLFSMRLRMPWTPIMRRRLWSIYMSFIKAKR